MSHKNFISAHSVSYIIQDLSLFSDLSFSISQNDRIALIGDNGAGKTTLLKIITKEITPSVGYVNSNANISYLPQINFEVFESELTIYEYLSSKMSNWWDTLIFCQNKFNIIFSEYQKLNTLSGGEIIKLVFGMAISNNPDILLLDEPTNHLDIESKNVLEELLLNINIPFVIVSHDIDFLDKVTNTTWYLHHKNLKVYGGNYSFFIEKQKEEIKSREQMLVAKDKEIKKINKSIEVAKIRANRNKNEKSSKKKNPKESVDKFAKAFFGNRSEKSFGKNNNSLNKRLQEVEKQVSELSEHKKRKVYFGIDSDKKSDFKIISLENADLYLDSKIFRENINFELKYGERLWIKGKNGSGKTLLVKAILKLFDSTFQSVSELKIISFVNNSVKASYLSQKYEIIDPNISLIENIMKNNSKIDYEEARRVLANYLFEDENKVAQKASSLSGGETARLAFAILSNNESDLLILDEPSNNLDISTKEILIRTINDFNGALIIISHDEYFVKQLSINKHISLAKRVSNNLKNRT